MGTNYYLRPPGTCPEQCDRWVHLGKSSVGWSFTFAASETATNYASWLKQLDQGEIYDEYGRLTSREDLLTLIANKRGGRNDLCRDDYHDIDGNRFVTGCFS